MAARVVQLILFIAPIKESRTERVPMIFTSRQIINALESMGLQRLREMQGPMTMKVHAFSRRALRTGYGILMMLHNSRVGGSEPILGQRR